MTKKAINKKVVKKVNSYICWSQEIISTIIVYIQLPSKKFILSLSLSLSLSVFIKEMQFYEGWCFVVRKDHIVNRIRCKTKKYDKKQLWGLFIFLLNTSSAIMLLLNAEIESKFSYPKYLFEWIRKTLIYLISINIKLSKISMLT